MVLYHQSLNQYKSVPDTYVYSADWVVVDIPPYQYWVVDENDIIHETSSTNITSCSIELI